VFFALDDIKEGKNPAIYRLKCKNEDENDHGGNKLPRDSSGRPWENQNGRDMNQLLGQIIEYDGFRNPHGDFWQSHPKWSSPTQRFGWDTPKVQIARIRRQKGFFVYNLDARRTLQEDIDDSPNMEKLSIDHSLVSKIKEELCKRGYHDLVLYLDLDRTFLKWTEQLRAKR
jgi:hypothetical protein